MGFYGRERDFTGRERDFTGDIVTERKTTGENGKGTVFHGRERDFTERTEIHGIEREISG